MVDTAISGFAVGAGFAVLENLTYIPDLSASGLITSAIRGLGTAMMHGGTTAIFGIVSVSLSEIRASRSKLVFLPGLAIAVFIHEPGGLWDELGTLSEITTAILIDNALHPRSADCHRRSCSCARRTSSA